MSTPKEIVESMKQDFRLSIWGIAPKGSLKYEKGMEIEDFLEDRFTTLLSSLIEEMGKVKPICTCLYAEECDCDGVLRSISHCQEIIKGSLDK